MYVDYSYAPQSRHLLPEDSAPTRGAYVCVEYNRFHTPAATFSRSTRLMGKVVSLSQHQATKNMQIREAENKAQAALLQASAAFKELHRLKGD